jgi:hypothetical protein
MPEFIIHVGPPKTGSKYLQSLLFFNRRHLLEAGICYPDIWWNESHHIFHFAPVVLLQNNRASELEPAFETLRSSGHSRIVLSCEGFGGVSTDQLKQLKVLMGDNNIKIVYYFRRWSDRIPSDWQQEIKMGQYVSMPEFILKMVEDPLHRPIINYALTLDRFASVFGRENLNIVSYSNLADHGVDIFDHFCQDILQIPIRFPLEGARIDRNISPGPQESEILRALNYLDFSQTGQKSIKMRIKFLLLRKSGLEIPELLRSAMEAELVPAPIHDGAAPFRPVYAALESYGDRLVGQQYGRLPFRKQPAKFQYVKSEYLLNRGVADALWNVYNEVDGSQISHPDLPKVG